MVVSHHVRDIIAQAVFRIPTGDSDEHRTATIAPKIVVELQARIRAAHETGKRLERATQAERVSSPEEPDFTKVADVIDFVLNSHRKQWLDLAGLHVVAFVWLMLARVVEFMQSA
jgi:hypothetical protein